MTFSDFLHYSLFKYEAFEIKVFGLFSLAVLFVCTKLLLWTIKFLINRRFKKSQDKSRINSLYQLAKYFVYCIALVVALEIVGIKFSFLLAGAAALLVGLGLGIQSIFNDLVSGILLLFEGSVSVGDIVEIDTLVGKVQKIEMRTSKVETRDGIIIIVPNSKLVSENVINWSHNHEPTRFKVTVGVAYGSDTQKVNELLVKATESIELINKWPVPTVHFNDFADSALTFSILFYTNNYFSLDQTKSDLRFEIDRLFRENDVTIPFPQRDLHIKSGQL